MSNKKDTIYFEELSWKQVDSLDREKTIFFLPISLLEEHGPHLPIGMDLIASRDLAVESVKLLKKKKPELTGVVLPAIPLGSSKANSDFPGTIHTRAVVIREIVFSICSSLADHDFKYMIICSWHLGFGHLKGIFQAMDRASSKLGMKVHEPVGPYFWCLNVNKWDEGLKKKGYDFDFDPEKQFHGCFRETSIMKYLHPDLVDKNHKELPSFYKNLMSAKECKGRMFKELGIKDGYVGSPSKANAKYGELHFKDIANLYADEAIKMHEGKDLLEWPDKYKKFMKLPFFNIRQIFKIR